ncbi:hypothetical protein EB796_007502 [Bugula neritina]|uniref:Uncharacterized protein n=1 Tax=Bugula neritina TaxID=10212 RepID=A0A7J7K7N3_BUGNE|nr:hypothetical protein EB796_007502 [Bugula neritina]
MALLNWDLSDEDETVSKRKEKHKKTAKSKKKNQEKDADNVVGGEDVVKEHHSSAEAVAVPKSAGDVPENADTDTKAKKKRKVKKTTTEEVETEKKVKKSKFTISDGLSHKSVVSEQQNNEGQQDSVQADGETSNQVTVVSKYNV